MKFGNDVLVQKCGLVMLVDAVWLAAQPAPSAAVEIVSFLLSMSDA